MAENYKSFVYQSVEDFKIQYIESNVVIHFRPAEKWKGTGYGFDWMRECDYDTISSENALGDKVRYEESIAKQYRERFKPTEDQSTLTEGQREAEQRKLDYDAQNPYSLEKDGKSLLLEEYTNAYQGTFVNDPESFYTLEKMYNYHQIILKKLKTRKWNDVSFEGYYCPWMSIYPDKTATLSLIAEQLTDKIPDSFEFVYNTDFFEISLLKEADLKKLKKGVKQPVPDAVTIKCLTEFDTDQTIAVYAITGTKKRLAGKLYVWSNEAAKQKKANVLSIIVKTKKTTIKDTSSPEEQSTIKQSILKLKDLNAEYLRQAMVELKDMEVITLDVSDDIHFKPKDSDGKGGHYYKSDGLVGYYTSAAKWKLDEVSGTYRWFYDNAPDDFIPLAQYMNQKLKEYLTKKGADNIDTYDNYLKVYYFDQKMYNTNGSTFGGLGGYSTSDYNAIVLPANTEADTLAHEILHAFNVMHSFSNKEFIPSSKFSFTAKTTDNIMDYSHLAWKKIPMNCLWKWQWIIANKSIMPDGSIKTTKQMKDEHIIIPI